MVSKRLKVLYRISLMVLTLIAVLSLTGCSGYQNTVNNKNISSGNNSNYFNYEVVETTDSPYGGEVILRDKETNVLYVMISGYSSGYMAPLLNSDGTPKLYK